MNPCINIAKEGVQFNFVQGKSSLYEGFQANFISLSGYVAFHVWIR